MLKKQRGMTLISWAVIGVVAGGIGLAVMKIVPAYMNYSSVKSIMDKLTRDNKIRGMTPKQIRNLLNKRLEINQLAMIYRKKNSFKFEKIDNGYKLILKYEQRDNLIKNLDYVVVFDHEVDLIVK